MRGIRNDPKDARVQFRAADFAALLKLSLLAWCLVGRALPLLWWTFFSLKPSYLK